MQGLHVDPLFRFLYPPNWSVAETGDFDARMVEVESPDRMAWISIRIQSDRTPEELLREALETMTGEYDGLQSDSVEAAIDGRVARGYDLEFVSFDFPVGGMIRTIDTPEGALLVMGQWLNFDVDDTPVSHADVIAAIMTSIELAFEDDD
jgi:hypothetical protein